MAHVNLLKQVKIDDRWLLRSIPKKANGQRDWSALPDGNYFIEFREKGKRRRLPAGAAVAQALEVQRRKQAELEAIAFGIIVPRPRTEDLPKPVLIDGLIDRYLDQIETLKKPNTFRKYDAVLRRFAKRFVGRTLDAVSVEDLNDFIVTLKTRWHVAQYGSTQCHHHRPVLQTQRPIRNHEAGALARTNLVASPRVHSGGAGQVSGRLR